MRAVLLAVFVAAVAAYANVGAAGSFLVSAESVVVVPPSSSLPSPTILMVNVEATMTRKIEAEVDDDEVDILAKYSKNNEIESTAFVVLFIVSLATLSISVI
jgi:hypothetical protein